MLITQPWDPSPDEARDELRRELITGNYQLKSPFDYLMEWLDRALTLNPDATGTNIAALVIAFVVLALVTMLGLYLPSRLRSTSVARREKTSLLANESQLSAAEVIAQAHQAVQQGRWNDAVSLGFQGAAMHHDESYPGQLQAQHTAREVAQVIGQEDDSRAAAALTSALVFELVAYADRDATSEQANQVLDLTRSAVSGSGSQLR